MKTTKILGIAVLATVMASCQKDDATIGMQKVDVSCTVPSELTDVKLVKGTVKLVNITTATEYQTEITSLDMSGFSMAVPAGVYNVTFEADVTYAVDGKTHEGKLRGYQESVECVDGNMKLNIKTELLNTEGGLVFAEIFFTGTQTPESKQYNDDKYFRIYNNSSDSINVAGYGIAESAFQTIKKYDYTPNIMGESVAVQALYVIPKDKDHYLQPGESIIICDKAVNHKEANENSFDLTGADYEWYDESTNPNFVDTDNPEVPNLDKYYCYTATLWGPHNRGYHSYFLVNMNDIDKETFLAENMYHHEWEFVFGDNSFPMSDDDYSIPNKNVVDAVNVSVEAEFQWIVTDPSLDMSWTHCGAQDHDASRYGHSIRRKTLSGKTLVDTNDSANDFMSMQKADPFYKF